MVVSQHDRQGLQQNNPRKMRIWFCFALLTVGSIPNRGTWMYLLTHWCLHYAQCVWCHIYWVLQETSNKGHEEVSHATAYLLHASFWVSNADSLRASVLSVVVVYGEMGVETQSKYHLTELTPACPRLSPGDSLHPGLLAPPLPIDTEWHWRGVVSSWGQRAQENMDKERASPWLSRSWPIAQVKSKVWRTDCGGREPLPSLHSR